MRVASMAVALGCAAVERNVKSQQYAGVPLSPTKGRGAERFWQAELPVRRRSFNYVSEHGRPDYFYIVDRQKLYLFYTHTSNTSMFERVLMEPSQVTEPGRIPGSLLKLLPGGDAEDRSRRAVPAEQRKRRPDAPRACADRAHAGRARENSAAGGGGAGRAIRRRIRSQ